ncbi:DUF3800 domain-containing protein [Paracoccus yeei]|uniref:DUF3800 domain-containing protein n=1 Tax=Paracoccus yeei TaxID=147645 RepID=UPI0037CBA5FC
MGVSSPGDYAAVQFPPLPRHDRVQQIRSHESELLQLTDILIGALTYANRGLATSAAKVAVITRLQERLGRGVLTRTSTFSATKFNLLVWQSRGAGE